MGCVGRGGQEAQVRKILKPCPSDSPPKADSELRKQIIMQRPIDTVLLRREIRRVGNRLPKGFFYCDPLSSSNDGSEEELEELHEGEGADDPMITEEAGPSSARRRMAPHEKPPHKRTSAARARAAAGAVEEKRMSLVEQERRRPGWEATCAALPNLVLRDNLGAAMHAASTTDDVATQSIGEILGAMRYLSRMLDASSCANFV